MQHLTFRRRVGTTFFAIVIGLLLSMSASWSAITDISTTPLGTSTSGTVVKPNILFILDASGSMDSEYEPDNVKANFACRPSSTGSTVCDVGDAPFQADQVNGMSYNPQVTYRPGVDYLGRSRGSMSNFASVPMDAYYAEEGKTLSTLDITKSWYHNGWCSSSTCTAATRVNGVHNAVNGAFAYATPPKPSITGVSFSRSGSTVTGTKSGHNVAVGDVIDVVGAGTCSAQQVQVTYADSTTFQYTWGDSLVPSCSGVQGTVNFSVRGYPEPANISLQPTTNVSRTSTTSITVTYPGHGFVVGDVVDVTGGAAQFQYSVSPLKNPAFTSSQVSSKGQTITVDWAGTTAILSGSVVSVSGGGANCNTPSAVITVVSPTRFVYPAPGNGQCSGTYTFNPTTVTVNRGTQLVSLADGQVVDVVGGGADCAALNVPIHVLSAGVFTYQVSGLGSCSGTYSVLIHACNSFGTGFPVANVLGGQFTLTTPTDSKACAGTYGISRRPANILKSANMNPVYFTISPTEYCSDPHLTDCVGATRPQSANIPGRPNGGNVNFVYPAYVRYCSSQAAAAAAPVAPASAPATAPSGTAITCVDKYYSSYVYPRYGMFTRGEIKPTITTYGNRPNRSDCQNAPNCTYTEEMTNFANWLAYYRKRIQAMKTSVGLSFSSLDDRYRVGFMIITFANDTSAVTCTYDKLTLTAPPCPTGTEFVPIDAFIPAQKQAFFNAMYSQIPAHGTPLRQALTRAGRYFAGLSSGISAGLTPDPVQYSCQQNFALLTTDGMWKDYPVDGDGAKLDGTPVGNQDNDLSDPSGVVSRAAGTFDGNCPAGDVTKSPGGCANTLADVAMYYYKTDLRTPALGNATGALGQDVSANNVPTTPTDPANWQHMTTFTLALADGLMNWQPDYATASTGDFKNIATGASGCWWSGSSACNWPSVVADTPTALDDLWHAAVNGHGQYFHAGDAQSLTAGLTGALAGMSARTAAASASATSSPNITQQDNVIYSTTYQTVNWTGQLVAQYIDTTTGNVLPGILWQAQQSLDALTGQTSDSRKIYTSGAFGGLRDFTYSNLDSTARNWLDNVCNTPGKLSQCASGVLSGSQISWLNTGENLVNFIRGWSQNEGIILRDRSHALGDTVDATPVYVRAPIFSFNDVGYNDFKRQQASRRQMIYLAANDGMLHAIDATVGTNSGGQEVWAYVPRMLIPNLYRLADINYPSRHTFFVDGSPSVMDAYINGSWRTVLVGGLNSGGRGYYALDITDPAQPQALWEFCSDATVCVQSDKSLGYSYGNPVITKLPSGRWVVLLTSGYNNVNPGDGQPHLFVRDLATGSPVADLTPSTTVTATSPVGLGCIAAWSEDFVHNNTAQYAYGGDLAGNLWRFDFTGSTPRMTKMGFLTDGNHRPQSITTRPELGLVNSQYRVVFVGTGRYLGLSDLTDPATWPQPSTDAWQQSFYAVKDTGGNLGEIRFSGGLVAQTLLPIGTQNRTTTANLVNWSDPAVNGWYVDFNPGNASPGERVNVDPVLVMGTLNIKTNVPSMNACTFGGESWVYQFRFDTGAYVSTAPGQIAGQRIDGATTVGFVIVGLPGGGLKDITTTATGEKRTFGVNIGASANGGRRIGWRELTP